MNITAGAVVACFLCLALILSHTVVAAAHVARNDNRDDMHHLETGVLTTSTLNFVLLLVVCFLNGRLGKEVGELRFKLVGGSTEEKGNAPDSPTI